MRALAGAELVLAGAELVLAGAKLINRRVELISKLTYHGTQVAISRQALQGRRGRLLEFSQQCYQVNTACAAATERLNRVVAGTSTLRVHWKGLLSLSGAQMVAGGYSEA